MENFPKQDRTVVNSLKAALKAAQEELKKAPTEESVQEIPCNFRGKVWFYLNQAIQNAKEKAEDLKSNDPSTNWYIHYEAFPQDLYDELEHKHYALYNSLKELGFSFYMTHNGPCHPMVKFQLHF